MTFKSYELTGLNCPYFTGVSEHGQKLTLDLGEDMIDRFEAYCEGTASLHIHQDGTMYITTMEYNNRHEEWEETIIEDLTNDASFRAEIDSWLQKHTLCRSRQFPYTVSERFDFWGSSVICHDLDSLLKYLKAY